MPCFLAGSLTPFTTYLHCLCPFPRLFWNCVSPPVPLLYVLFTASPTYRLHLPPKMRFGDPKTFSKEMPKIVGYSGFREGQSRELQKIHSGDPEWTFWDDFPWRMRMAKVNMLGTRDMLLTRRHPSSPLCGECRAESRCTLSCINMLENISARATICAYIHEITYGYAIDSQTIISYDFSRVYLISWPISN